MVQDRAAAIAFALEIAESVPLAVRAIPRIDDYREGVAATAGHPSSPVADEVAKGTLMVDQRPLDGQVALVTGASRGIGKQIAIELGRLGASVAVAARTVNQRGRLEDTIGETVAIITTDFVRTAVTSPPGDEIRLTSAEWTLVTEMARHPGRLIGRRHTLEATWGPAVDPDAKPMRMHLLHLVKKLEPAPARPRSFITEVRMGCGSEPGPS